MLRYPPVWTSVHTRGNARDCLSADPRVVPRQTVCVHRGGNRLARSLRSRTATGLSTVAGGRGAAVRPALRPQGETPSRFAGRGSPARPASGREARGFVLGGIPPPVLARLGASAQTLSGSRRWAGVAASLAQPRPPLLSGAGVGARLSPALFRHFAPCRGVWGCAVSRRCKPAFLVCPGGWFALPPGASGGGGRARCPLPPLPPGFSARPACGGSGAVPCRGAASPPSLVFWGSWFAPLAAWRAAPACPGVRPSSVRASLTGGRRSLRCGFALRPARGLPGPPWGARPAGFGGRALRAPGLCGGLRPRFLRPAPALFRRVRARGDACRGWPGVFRRRSGRWGCVPRLGGVPLRAGAGQLCAPHSVRKGGVCAPIPPAPFPVGKGGRKADGLPCGGYHGGAGLSRASGLAGACAPLDTPFPHDVR